MNLLKLFRDHFGDVYKRDCLFLSIVPGDDYALTCLYVLWSYLDSDRHAFHLILRELPAGGIIGIVKLYSKVIFKCRFDLPALFENTLLVLCYRYDYRLNRSYGRGKDKPVVVTVRHYNRTYKPCCYSPGGLMGIYLLIFFVGIHNVERFCEPVAEIMTCTRLKGFSVVHKRFYRISCLRTCEFVVFRFSALNYRHCQAFGAEICI